MKINEENNLFRNWTPDLVNYLVCCQSIDIELQDYVRNRIQKKAYFYYNILFSIIFLS